MSTEIKTVSAEQEVLQHLTRNSAEIQKVLPAHITPDKFVRVVMTAIQGSPELLTKCTRQSLYLACKEAAQDGLLPDDREGAIIPYGSEAVWTPMVGGICKRARNSGEISTMNAFVVYTNDKFEMWEDETGPHFKHMPAHSNRGDELLTFAYAILKDGSVYAELIDKDQMCAIEAASPGSKTPWKTKFRGEMMRKSALRRLCKYRLPSSTDLDGLVRRDDKFYDLKQEERIATDSGTSSRLKAAVATTATVIDVPAEQKTTQVEQNTAMLEDFRAAMSDAGTKEILDDLLVQVKASKLTDESKQLLELHHGHCLKKLG
jgi:recombination protein RecT